MIAPLGRTLLGAVAAMLIVGCGAIQHAAGGPPKRVPPADVSPLSQATGNYLGVYELGTPRSYVPVAQFAARTDARPNIVLYYSAWGEPFRSAFARTAFAHGATTLVQINPFGTPMAGIAKGHADAFLRSYADQIRTFRHPVIIGFAHEMNGPWYKWGYRHTSPGTWIAAWRHVVSVFRSQGAYNVTWLWTVNRDGGTTGPLKEWWPGTKYVTWVGITGYYTQPGDSFQTVFAPTIAHVRLFTQKPILLSETAVGPVADQARKIPNLFAGIRPFRLLGLVWFDVHQYGSLYRQDWRLEDNPPALAAFRHQVKIWARRRGHT
jgi:mannan endo-1,4-beta-mannosidase